MRIAMLGMAFLLGATLWGCGDDNAPADCGSPPFEGCHMPLDPAMCCDPTELDQVCGADGNWACPEGSVPDEMCTGFAPADCTPMPDEL